MPELFATAVLGLLISRSTAGGLYWLWDCFVPKADDNLVAAMPGLPSASGPRPDEPRGRDNLPGTPDELWERRRRVAAFVKMMDAETLDLAIPVMQALAAIPRLQGA